MAFGGNLGVGRGPFRKILRVRGKMIGVGLVYWAKRNLARSCLLGQVSTDVNDVVGDHTQSDPTPDAGRPSIE